MELKINNQRQKQFASLTALHNPGAAVSLKQNGIAIAINNTIIKTK
jgi:hypothetical protein